MQAYSWPGNVRELTAAIARAAALTESDSIESLDLATPSAPERPVGPTLAEARDASQFRSVTCSRPWNASGETERRRRRRSGLRRPPYTSTSRQEYHDRMVGTFTHCAIHVRNRIPKPDSVRIRKRSGRLRDGEFTRFWELSYANQARGL